MLTNINHNMLRKLINHFSLPKLYFLEQNLFRDNNVFINEHHKISAIKKIQKNWRTYKNKNKFSYGFALHPEEYSPSGYFNLSRIDECYLELKFK